MQTAFSHPFGANAAAMGMNRVRVAALILACVGTIMVAAPAPADAQAYVGTSGESPQDALSRNLKTLATSPKDFQSLIGAGKAALALGDTQSAAGFFGRAEEVWPDSPMPQAGMGAALAIEGNPAGALQFFARAQQRGATTLVFGADRGLAYDLLGQHAQAQADYRAALAGADRDEARRRLALSLAISGNRAEALTTLGPLMARGDSAAARCRAFVLALSGDVAGARAAIEAAMPGASYQMEQFFRQLPTLRSDQKAAAVHLGEFPQDPVRLAANAPNISVPAPATGGDRLSSIDQLLAQQASPTRPVTLTTPPKRQQMASVSIPATQARRKIDDVPDGTAYSDRRIWLQLSSGTNAAAFSDEFRRLKSRGREVFDGISGYVAEDRSRARLIIGPFRNSAEAEIFAGDLETLRIDSFAWTNAPGQIIRKLPSE